MVSKCFWLGEADGNMLSRKQRQRCTPEVVRRSLVSIKKDPVWTKGMQLSDDNFALKPGLVDITTKVRAIDETWERTFGYDNVISVNPKPVSLPVVCHVKCQGLCQEDGLRNYCVYFVNLLQKLFLDEKRDGGGSLLKIRPRMVDALGIPSHECGLWSDPYLHATTQKRPQLSHVFLEYGSTDVAASQPGPEIDASSPFLALKVDGNDFPHVVFSCQAFYNSIVQFRGQVVEAPLDQIYFQVELARFRSGRSTSKPTAAFLQATDPSSELFVLQAFKCRCKRKAAKGSVVLPFGLQLPKKQTTSKKGKPSSTSKVSKSKTQGDSSGDDDGHPEDAADDGYHEDDQDDSAGSDADPGDDDSRGGGVGDDDDGGPISEGELDLPPSQKKELKQLRAKEKKAEKIQLQEDVGEEQPEPPVPGAPASSSSSSSSGGNAVIAPPPLVKTYFSKQIGLCGASIGKKSAKCMVCDMPIGKGFARLEYAYSTVRPYRHIHPGCISGIPRLDKLQTKQWLQDASASGRYDTDPDIVNALQLGNDSLG
jgi:hypothetical protein